MVWLNIKTYEFADGWAQSIKWAVCKGTATELSWQ